MLYRAKRNCLTIFLGLQASARIQNHRHLGTIWPACTSTGSASRNSRLRSANRISVGTVVTRQTSLGLARKRCRKARRGGRPSLPALSLPLPKNNMQFRGGVGWATGITRAGAARGPVRTPRRTAGGLKAVRSRRTNAGGPSLGLYEDPSKMLHNRKHTEKSCVGPSEVTWNRILQTRRIVVDTLY